MSGIMYILGLISLILAPFTGVTLVSAACFFVIGYIMDVSGL
jgi:hypothetical protein